MLKYRYQSVPKMTDIQSHMQSVKISGK